MSNDADKPPLHSAGQSFKAGSVPVFNCLACLSPPDAEGWITARCSNLSGIVVRGKTQREALAALVAEFKAAVSRYHAAGQPIPWSEPPSAPEPGEQQRWIAVHL